jgi:2-polyprenyl-3-methyl-5-hydroxy-6-metoxy-1,4-benzoquinol methylase
MPQVSNELTTRDHWDDAWDKPPRWRLPSKASVSTRNIQRIIARHVQPGMRYLELGCAPGKMLAWVASELEAEVAGLDYSERGIEWTRRLFETVGLRGDLRCESVWTSTFEPATFDVVFSAGLIEHFDDPRPIVNAHVALLKPGGRALITVPHYGGIYGRLQRWLDPQNLQVHNLAIMNTGALRELAPAEDTCDVRAYAAGRLSPWLLSISHRLPRPVALGVSHVVNGIGLIQPVDIPALCPMLVLEIVRSAPPC